MTAETIDERELADMRMQAERRAAEAWSAYSDPTLKEQISKLSEREKQAVNKAVANFIFDEMARQKTDEKTYCNDFVFRSVKPVGGKGDLHEFHSNRPIHRNWPRETFKEMDIEFSEAIDTDFFDYLAMPNDMLRRSDIVVQIIPVSDQEVIIRCDSDVMPSNHDGRGGAWNFNILTFKGDGSIDDFLKHGSGGKLLPFIARNLITAIDPQNAILCDAGVGLGGGMEVIDFDELSLTEYSPSSSTKLSGGKGEKKKFNDKATFLSHLKSKRMKGRYAEYEIRNDPSHGDYMAFFSYDEHPNAPKQRFSSLQYNYPPDKKPAFE